MELIKECINNQTKALQSFIKYNEIKGTPLTDRDDKILYYKIEIEQLYLELKIEKKENNNIDDIKLDLLNKYIKNYQEKKPVKTILKKLESFYSFYNTYEQLHKCCRCDGEFEYQLKSCYCNKCYDNYIKELEEENN
jgi:hypothetical protein